MAATHFLMSQEQKSLSGLNCSKTHQPHTFWRFTNRHDKQASKTMSYNNYLHSREPRVDIVSKLGMQQGTQSLTNWGAKNRHGKLAWNIARCKSHSQATESGRDVVREETLYAGFKCSNSSYSHSEGPMTDNISRWKHSKSQSPLTNWNVRSKPS